MSRKTLRQKSYEYYESKDLFDIEESKAKTHIIFGKLKLKFLKWLKTSGPGNHKTSWETEEFDPNNMREVSSWSDAIMKFIEDLQSDDFFVDIRCENNKYQIEVALWDESQKNPEAIKILKEEMNKRNKIPYEVLEELDTFFRGVFNLHEKDSNFDHPKYKEFQDLVYKYYKKNMSAEKLKSILVKGTAKNKSPLSKLF